MASIETELKQLMSSLFSVGEETINETASMKTIQNWDSLQHLNLIIAIEERFGIKFETGEIPKASSYPALCKYIEAKT